MATKDLIRLELALRNVIKIIVLKIIN